MTIAKTLETLVQDGFILVFNQDKLDVVKTASALIEAGFMNMEITCRIKHPLQKMAQVRRELPEFVVGAASLTDYPGFLDAYNLRHGDDPLPSVEQVVDAGVQYLVSAGNFSPETYARYAGRLPIIPGCATVSEILAQFAMGANLCKVFPAKEVGGPAFVKAIDPAIHKTISLVPTGGTNSSNIPDYIAAGVLVLGGSFSAIDKATMAKIVDEQDYGLLASELKQVKEFVDRCRAQQWPALDLAKAGLPEAMEATGRDFNIR